jgi:hypothetical protein
MGELSLDSMLKTGREPDAQPAQTRPRPGSKAIKGPIGIVSNGLAQVGGRSVSTYHSASAHFSRQGLIEEARKTLTAAMTRRDLDWPEAVFDASLLLENVHGSLQTLNQAREAIEREQNKVAKRREQVQEIYYQPAETAPVPEPQENVQDTKEAPKETPVVR